MKKILLAVIVLFGAINVLKAQTDYCKDITKTTKGSMVIYNSPTPGDKEEDVSVFAFRKIIDDNGAHTFFRVGTPTESSENTASDIIITFDDDDVLKFSNPTFNVGNKNAINQYVHYTTIELTNDDLAKFKTKKIKFYNILGLKRYLGMGSGPKNKILGYANCIDNLNDAPAPVINANEKKSIDGFWGIKFGASMDEVKAAVQAKGGTLDASSSKSDALIFNNITFTDRHADFLRVQFVDGKFFEAFLSFPASDDAGVISKFNTMFNELGSVYGPGVLYKKFEPPYDTGNGEYDVQAIKLGKATYLANWKTNNKNTIQLQIDKDLGFSLFYTDRTLSKAKTAQKSNDY